MRLLGVGLPSPAREEAVTRSSPRGSSRNSCSDLPEEVDIVALSGTSGGAMCAALAWDGLVRGDRTLASEKLGGLLERDLRDRALGPNPQ